jgi:hypothetical protein
MNTYILAKAMTNSEWDNVDYALIRLNETHLKFLVDVMKDARKLNKKYDGGFMYIKISADMADFCQEMESELSDLLVDGNEWSIVGLDSQFVDELPRPDQEIRYGGIKITETSVQYVAYGKHTDEEFWISEIDIEELKKSFITTAEKVGK